MTFYIGVDYGIRKLALAAFPKGGRRGPSGAFSHFWPGGMSHNEILADSERVLHKLMKPEHFVGSTVVIEYPFFAKNARTAVRMGMMAGALYTHASKMTRDIIFVPPAEWKREIVGKGNANKDETMTWIKTNTTWSFRNDDEADSLCMAVYGKRFNNE